LNKKYDNVKSFFGKEMTNHFPEKINNDNKSFTESLSPELGTLELVFIDTIESISIGNIINKLEKKSIAIYNANDTCLLIVNRFATEGNYYDVSPSKTELELVDKNCYSKLFPIPNFWHNDLTTEETYCKLPPDFRLYVIDAKSGKYFDEKYLTDGRYMPQEWKNGYSKGVAVSKKRNIAIYWLNIW